MREIIGVIGDVKYKSLSTDARAEIYLPYAQVPFTSLSLVVRSDTEPLGLLRDIRHQVNALDKELPIDNVRTLDQYLADSIGIPLLLAFVVLLTVIQRP